MTTLDEIRLLAPAGMLGAGFRDDTLARGLAFEPHIIACDAGSTDAGPYFLGTGRTSFGLRVIARDLQRMLAGARKIGVPLIIGSAGGAGGNPHVDLLTEMILGFMKAEGLHGRLSILKTEVDRDLLKRRLAEGRVHALDPVQPLDDAIVDGAKRIVGMIGAEPLIESLEDGADIILAGRTSDTALFAAYPLWKGFPPGLSWHAGKILECGAAAVQYREESDGMMARLTRDWFELIPPNPSMRCTPQSVAAHSLYENADPYKLVESVGTIDLAPATYEAITDRIVRVRGSEFHPSSNMTVKLEGVRFAGFQSVVVAGARDPHVLASVAEWEQVLQTKVRERMNDVAPGADYVLNMRIYGRDGVMGKLEPDPVVRGHEICFVLEVTAESQELANSIAGVARHKLLHLPVKRWSGFITGVACIHNPPQLERGEVYEFILNHAMEVDHAMETVQRETIDL